MSQDTNTTAADQLPPDDFNEYVAFRGKEAEAKPAAATAPAKTEPNSGADKTEQKAEATEEAPAKDAAEESDTEAGKENETDEEKPAEEKKKGGFQRRIDKLTREKRELAERVAALEAKGEKPPEKPAEKPAAEATDKPKPDDFETYEAFTEALTDWKLAQRDKATAEKQTKDAQAAEQDAAVKTWQTKEAAVREAHDDYDEVMEAAEDIQIPHAMMKAIAKAENGPELAYELAKDAKEAERIAQITDPIQIALELGKFSAKIAKSQKSDSAPKPKAPITGAPKPVTPLRGGGKASGSTPDVTDPAFATDYNAWEKERNRQLKAG